MSKHSGEIAATQHLAGRRSYFVDGPRVLDANVLLVVSRDIVDRNGEAWRGIVELTPRKSLSSKVYPEIDLVCPCSREGRDIVAAPENAGLR